MKKTRLRYISPISLAKNLGLLFFCFGAISSIIAAFFQILGADVTLGGPVPFTEASSRSAFVWFLNPLIVGAYGYLTGLLGGWFYNLAANKTGGLVYYLDAGEDANDPT